MSELLCIQALFICFAVVVALDDRSIRRRLKQTANRRSAR